MTAVNARGSFARAGEGLRRGFRAFPASGWVSTIILVVVALVAIFGPLLYTTDPNVGDLSGAFVGPSIAHPLGQDDNGRDLLARLIGGSRTALIGPLVVVVVSTVLGTLLALASVWFGGWFDTLVSRIMDAIFAFPGLLLAILAVAIFGAGLQAATIALSIAYTPYIFRIVRGAALRERSMPYVAALRIQGLRGAVISLRHILPNIGTLVVANATISFGFAFLDLAGLSFIGLGVQAPAADWGAMISEGMTGLLQQHPQEVIYASILIVLTVAATNMLGDRLNERSEARQ